MILIHPMGMPAFNLIVPSHEIPPLILGAIVVVAIIEAAVVVTIKAPVVVSIEMAVAVTVVYTISEEAALVTDLTEAILDGGLVHGTSLLIILATFLLVTNSTLISQKALIPFTQLK